MIADATEAARSAADAANALLQFSEPYITQASQQLREAMDLCWTLPFDFSSVEEKLCAGLRRQLLSLTQRTLALELNVARLENKLKGDTPESRFDNFVESFPAIRDSLFREYPVMVRAIRTSVQQWVDASSLFLKDLGDDWNLLTEKFSDGQHAGAIEAMLVGAGDLHQRGRSAILLKFASGLKLVYKPHSLAVNEHFQGLLRWLNDRGFGPGFHTLRHVLRNTHGWVEFVPFCKCETVEGMHRFYRRQGGLLAVLFALCATDMHSENLVAFGEHPVIVDLETLFHPKLSFDRGQDKDAFAKDVMSSSVIRIGLLPSKREVKGIRIDSSGMGRAPGQQVPAMSWDRPATDEMRLVETMTELPGLKNRPAADDYGLRVSEFVQDVRDGFGEVYEIFCASREDLLSESGPIEPFRHDEIRVVLRSTRKYAELLNADSHPDFQRSWQEHSQLFDKLWNGAGQWQNGTSAIPYERLDLEQGDIPFFTTRPDSKDIWTSGGERIRDFLSRSGYSLVLDRIRSMSTGDKRFQEGIIEHTVAHGM